MTVEQLAAQMQNDEHSEAPRRIRHYCTQNRAYRAASIALTAYQRRCAGVGGQLPIDVERLAQDVAELEQREAAGLLIGITLFVLQAVFSWLIRRALDRLMESQGDA